MALGLVVATLTLVGGVRRRPPLPEVALTPYQLEALARLCFELQSTDELGTLAATHA